MQKTALIFPLFLALAVLQVTASVVFDNGQVLNLDPTTAQKFQQFLAHKEEIGNWIWNINVRREDPVISCGLCEIAIDSVLTVIHDGSTVEFIEQAVVDLCIMLQIVPDDVCLGAAHNYVPAAVYILQERDFLTTNDICSILIQDSDCKAPNATLTDWDITVNPNKPPVVTPPLLPEGLPTAKVLQLTDIHLDLNYVEGSLADCDGPLCCLAGSGTPENASQAAGHFGAYQCDFPEVAMNAVFKDAAERFNDEYAFVLLTGDYVHHAVWATSATENSLHNTHVAASLENLFKNSVIYPVLGNHEPHPCNMYAPRDVWDDFDLSWMFENMANLYSQYLPADALESFRTAGYYTVSPSKGLRLVVLNTNFCYTLNFWLLYNTVDPEGQLQWFADTMLAAEEAGEVVMVVGHVPPGHYQCWSPWNEKFNRVINRFEGIIKAQFYGHTHEDDFKIFFDNTVGHPRPTSSLYIGASVTTYTDLNPGYKVYHFDGVDDGQRTPTWEMVDHETYIYNLTLANMEGGSPTMYKLYNARDAYSLESLRPNDLYDFVVRMVNDADLFHTFYRHFNKDADTMEPCEDSTCRLNRLCEVVTTDIKDQTHCARLEALLEVPK